MENGLQRYTQPTLISELRDWNRQELLFKEVFSEKSLSDRDFQKMKLAEYARIYGRYAKTASTTDERAFARMLKFQQTKIRKAVYPGLTGRLKYYIINIFKPPLDGRQEAAMASQMGSNSYVNRTLPVKDGPTERQSQNFSQPLQPRNNYRQKQRPAKRHKKGRSI
jgi:hypothetical protein